MKKKTIVIIVIGGLVLLAALWGASRHLDWFEGKEAEPVDTFAYDESVPIDMKNNDLANNNEKETELVTWDGVHFYIHYNLDPCLKKKEPKSLKVKGEYFPWEDVRPCLKNKTVKLKTKCPKCARQLKRIYFISPAYTWENLCGRAGWLTVCVQCKLQFDFDCESMN